MQSTARGYYRNGRIELIEVPEGVAEDVEVVVTFLQPGHECLTSLGITPEQAAEFRWGLGAGIEDWDSPEMDVYNDYDRYKAEFDKTRQA